MAARGQQGDRKLELGIQLAVEWKKNNTRRTSDFCEWCFEHRTSWGKPKIDRRHTLANCPERIKSTHGSRQSFGLLH